jgi:hypothetical protein
MDVVGIIRVASTMAKSGFLKGARNRAKAKPAMELARTMPIVGRIDRMKLFSIHRPNNGAFATATRKLSPCHSAGTRRTGRLVASVYDLTAVEIIERNGKRKSRQMAQVMR